MYPYECKLVFQDGRLTWTETYYRLDVSSQSALVPLRQLARQRQHILGGQTSIISIRAARIYPRGDVSRDGVNPGPVGSPGAHPALAILCRMAAGPTLAAHLYSTPLYLRGCPATFFSDVGRSPAPGLAQPSSRILQYLSVLPALGFCLQVASRALARYPIAGVTWFALDDADCRGVALNPHTLPLDDGCIVLAGDMTGLLQDIAASGQSTPKVRVKGLTWQPREHPSLPRVNGIHTPLGVEKGGVFLVGKLPATGYAQKLGTVRLATSIYPAIAGGSIEGVTRRDVGGRSKMRAPLLPRPLVLPPTAAAPPPPVAGPPQLGPPIEPPPPVVGSIATALDLVTEIFDGYTKQPDGTVQPIGLYPMLNFGKAWLVLLSGTSLNINSATFINEDILAGVGLPNKFSLRVESVLEKLVPPPANLWLAGHSLGGMIVQSIRQDLAFAGYTVYGYTNFGTPIFPDLGFRGPHNSLLMVNDIAFAFTPGSLVVTAAGLAASAWYTVIRDPDAPVSPIAAHNFYPSSRSLAQYDWVGERFSLTAQNAIPIQFGQPIRVTVPWYYPPTP